MADGSPLVVGVTPIGGEGFDWRTTVISQFANSGILLEIIDDFSQCVDPSVNIDSFYDNVWNIATATGYGLDVWGRIVNIGRVITVAPRYFGFAEAGDTSSDPYNVSPFYSGAVTTNNFSLADDAYRQVILAKALANICDGSVLGINKILQLLFPGRGNCYVTDPGDMTMTYTFEFALTPVEIAIVTSSGALPSPTGVLTPFSIP